MSHVSTVDDAAADRHAFRFFHTLRVRWAEVDRQGIVFNGHYLTYFDVAITEYWRAIGVPYPAITDRWGSDLFVVKASVEYHAPAHYDDVLDIGVRVALRRPRRQRLKRRCGPARSAAMRALPLQCASSTA